MRRDKNTVEGFAKHAEVYGTECVFETAIHELSIKELGTLSRRLQRIDPRWLIKTVLPMDAGDFAAMLIDRGFSVKDAAAMAQVTPKTASAHHQAGQYSEMGLRPAL